MTVRINLRGQILELDDDNVQTIMRALAQHTMSRIWLPARVTFDSKYERWQRLNEARGYDVVLWSMELLGGATLPSQSRANGLRSRRNTLNNRCNPRGLERFYQFFGRWHEDAQRFNRAIYDYESALQIGGGRFVRGLAITRDASFLLLAALAALPSGGGSLAVTGTSAAGRALVAGAGQAFAVRTIESCATLLGRSLAGERVTPAMAATQIAENAVNAVPDAMMGQLVGRFMRPLTGTVSEAAAREIARGNLASGVSMQFSSAALEGLVGQAIDQYIGRNPARVRSFVQSCPAGAPPGRIGRMVGEAMMADRTFRQNLERVLEAGAPR